MTLGQAIRHGIRRPLQPVPSVSNF